MQLAYYDFGAKIRNNVAENECIAAKPLDSFIYFEFRTLICQPFTKNTQYLYYSKKSSFSAGHELDGRVVILLRAVLYN